MKTTIKKAPKSQLKIEIEIPAEEFEKYIEQATLKLGENLEVEGFRKGKVPKDIIEKKIEKGNILVTAADLAIKENYPKTILENKIEEVGEPQIDILKLAPGNPFVFQVMLPVLPEIKLPDYKKIASQVQRNKIFVQVKEIEDALEWLKKSRAKFSLKNKPAERGDFVEIEYWSPQVNFNYLNFGPKESQLAGQKDAFILGQGHFIPGFEEELIGLKDGEEKIFSVTLPESHYLKNLAGKKVELKARMISVQKVEFPEVNDQFAQNLGKFEDLNALKKSIKEGLNLEKEQAESQRMRNEILEKISEKMEFEIPDFLISREQKVMLEELRQGVSEDLKIPFSEYLAKIKKTEKEIIDSFLPQARKRVKNLLILREIGKQEKIDISEEEVKDEINKILKHYSSVERAEKELDIEKLKLYTKGVIRTEKILKLLEELSDNR